MKKKPSGSAFIEEWASLGAVRLEIEVIPVEGPQPDDDDDDDDDDDEAEAYINENKPNLKGDLCGARLQI